MVIGSLMRGCVCCLLLGLASGVAHGQNGVVFLEAGVPSAPADQPGGKTTMTAVGGTQILISGWVDDVPAGLLNGYDIAFPCQVVSDQPGAGDLTWVQGSLAVTQQNPDYVFLNMGSPPPGIGGGCPPSPFGPFAGTATFGPPVTVNNPKYVVEVMYDVPTDADGTYWLEVACTFPNPPDCPAELSHLLNNMGGTLPDVTFYGIDITVEQCPEIGDIDGDGDLDLQDFTAFHECATGPVGPVDPPAYPAECRCLDANDDGDVDLGDFTTFQRNFTG